MYYITYIYTAIRRDGEKEESLEPLDFNDDRDERVTQKDDDITEKEKDDRRERNKRNRKIRTWGRFIVGEFLE